MKKTLMVMAGGTGGHVFPAIAVADFLKALDWKIVWLASKGGMENGLIENKGYEKAQITIKGVRGKGVSGWILMPLRLLVAFVQSFKAMRHYSPDVVIGMGGFAAFPGGFMAWVLRKPLVIHEQNSVEGLTNKLLAKVATKILTAFPSAFRGKGKLVGNPVRKDLLEIQEPQARYESRAGSLRLLVIGGSLGAQALNEIVPKAIGLFPKASRPKVVHQSGNSHIGKLRNNYKEAGVEADCIPFIEDMAESYDWADFVICRSGAMTIAELSAIGVASLLVPFPYAVDDHQTTNARYLSDSGAAILVQQQELTAEGLVGILSELTRGKCLEIAKRAYALGKPDATENVAQTCMELAE